MLRAGAQAIAQMLQLQGELIGWRKVRHFGLGVVPCVIGLFQAIESLKLVAGFGQPLVGRLLTFDALGTTFNTLKLRRDPKCPVCSDGAKITFIDYEQFCSTAA